MIRLSKGL